MSMQTEGNVDDALNNLNAIQSGEQVFEQVFDREGEIEFYRDPKNHWTDRFEIEKQRVIELFVQCCNIVEPAHPYVDDPYPIKLSDVENTHCTSSGSYNAKCGPRNGISNVVHFSIDRRAVSRWNIESVYRLIVHELTHITEGSHSEGSNHNPTFWKQFARNAVALYEARPLDHDIDWSLFFTYCRNNPNRAMTDKRMRTVEEQQQEVEDEIRRHL